MSFSVNYYTNNKNINNENINNNYDILLNNLIELNKSKENQILFLENQISILTSELNNLKFQLNNNNNDNNKNENNNIIINSHGNSPYIFSNGNINTPSVNSINFNLNENNKKNNKIIIKNYLKEVKNKLDSNTFNQFVNYIRLLNKNNNNLSRNNIIEKVKILFGPQYNDLFEINKK